MSLFIIQEQVEKKIFGILACGIAISISFKAIYNSIFCIALFLFWLLFMQKKLEWQKIKVTIMIATLFLLALLGMFYTDNLEEGLWHIQQQVLLLMFPLIFGTIRINWQIQFKWIVSFLIIGIIISCCLCLINAFWHFIKYQNGEKFFSHGLVEYIDIYPYVLALLCLVAAILIIYGRTNDFMLFDWLKRDAIVAVLIFFLTIFIFLLGVKQIFITCLSCVSIFLATRYLTKRFILTTLSVSLIAGVLAINSVPSFRTRVIEILTWRKNAVPDHDTLVKIWNGTTMRKAVWSSSLDVISQNFWFGVGTGDGQDALQDAYERKHFYIASRYNRFHAHNQYLQVLVTFGVIGFVIWSSSMVGLICINKRNTMMIYIIGCFMFEMLTESILETNKGILSLAFVFTVFSMMWVQQNDKV